MAASASTLFDPFSRSHTAYRHVYRHKKGYAAKIRTAGRLLHLGTRPSAREAAELVAAAYADRYGPDWALKVRMGAYQRRANPWEVREDRHLGGWVVTVWEWGRPVTLGRHLHPTRPALDWPHRREPWVFPTRAEAKEALARWRRTTLVGRWGLFAALALGR